MSTPLEEMHTAVQRLNEAADAYYTGRAERMTDFEWDQLFDRLKALETQTGVVLPDSPTQRVSADHLAGGKEIHQFKALSLAKTKRIQDLVLWAENRPIYLSWKLDGLTLVVTYQDGHLTKVVTRGDGTQGTRVTHLAPAIRGIPPTIDAPGTVIVRGEAVISYADFEQFCAESTEDYANPRNLASGSLTLKDPAELKNRHLQFVPFTLVSCPLDAEGGQSLTKIPPAVATHWGARMDWLDALGFSCVARERIEEPTLEQVQHVVNAWTARVTARENPFPVDGLVICYEDVAYARTGSVTGHHATRAGLAFKWADETASTQLVNIEWSCAVASIAPVAVFRAVELEGTTVQRASLCNISECERLGIGGAGSVLSVIKANKIIPKVVAVTEKVGDFEIPTCCPVCGAPTEVLLSEAGTKRLVCTNAHCPARELRKFIRFVSKEGMNIEGLAGETLAKFVNRGWIRSFADIYRLGDHAQEIASMEGFGAKSATNLVQALARARMRNAVNFLFALSIPLCGSEVAKRLLSAYSLTDLFACAEQAAHAQDLFSPRPDVFTSIEGVGEVISRAFVAWFGEEQNRIQVKALLAEVSLTAYEKPTRVGTCAGLKFVITGEVHHFANRTAFKEFVVSQGGHVTGSVSKSTHFLINNEATSTSSKNRTAQSLGIPILTEDEFVARFGHSECAL